MESINIYMLLLTGSSSISIISYMFERTRWFISKSSSSKKQIMVIACFLITALSCIVASLPKEVIEKLISPIEVISSGVLFLFTSKVVHFFDKKKV